MRLECVLSVGDAGSTISGIEAVSSHVVEPSTDRGKEG